MDYLEYIVDKANNVVKWNEKRIIGNLHLEAIKEDTLRKKEQLMINTAHKDAIIENRNRDKEIEMDLILKGRSITNNESINYNPTDIEKGYIGQECFHKGVGIYFDGARIEAGKLVICGCDHEDMVNATIKNTEHILSEGCTEPIKIKEVISSGILFRRDGFDVEYYSLPKKVIIIWE